MTLRLDGRTRAQLKGAARRRGLTPSAAARLAVDKWLEDEAAAASLRPYELVKDLVGRVAGGDPRRSSGGSRAIAETLKARRRRTR